MIVKYFNNGWGGNWPIAQLEQSTVDAFLATQPNATVVINSTWYTQDYHQQVLAQLKTLSFEQIVLVALLDPAIPQPHWYAEFDCPVKCLGYYPGDHQFDFWAMVLNKFYQPADITHSSIDTAYMCLNRKPHQHRVYLYNQLKKLNLLDHGIVSLGGNPPVRALPNDVGYENLTPNAGPEQYGIGNDIVSLGPINLWNRCLVNVVTETAWDINRTGFVSEKIYKPIVGLRPFLVYDPTGAVDWLTQRGFEPYVNDFKDITDLDLSKAENIPEFLKILCGQTPEYFQSKYLALQSKIMYNKNYFYQYVKGPTCQI